MIQLIAFIIFMGSFGGILLMLAMKAPVIATMPQNGSTGLRKPAIAAKAERKIKELHFHFFSKQMLLHKILSMFRIWTLKAERYIDTTLHRIRKKAQELDRELKKK